MKVIMLTTSADADGIVHAGTAINLPKAEAEALISGGFAKPFEVEQAVVAPAENAVSRRGRSRSVSGDEE